VLYALKVERQSVVPHLVSESITALLGFTLPEALHYEWWMGQLHPEDRDMAVASISETLSQGASLTEYRLRHKDGTYRWVEDKRRLIRDSSNQPAEIVGIWADITERKRAEEVLLKSSRQKVGRQKARILWDLAVIFGLAVAAWVFCYNTDILVPPLRKLVFQFKDNIDDLLGPPVILLVGFLVFSYRRWRDAHNQFTEQAGVEEALRTLHGELENRIQLRTAELTKANDTLRMEAAEREKAKETIRQSEERFRQLAENITDVFWICSPDLQKVLYVSPAYEKIWGRSAARLADHPLEWGEAILPEDREGVFATYARLTTGEPSVKLEYRITRSDGEVRWMHSRGFQVRDVAGKVIRVAGVARDITESKKAEEAIRQSEERFRELAQNINEVFWMTNPAMTEILYVSPAYEKIWGQSCESLYVSPRSWLEAIHSEDRDRVTTSLAQALTKGGYSLEYRICRKDGTCRWVEDHNRVVRDAEGKPTRLVGVWSDITDRKRVDEEIQNQLLELQRWHEAMLGREERILGLKCEVSRGQNPLAQGLARRRRVRPEKILLKLAS
jgi:PAS domain S-box-containing protein